MFLIDDYPSLTSTPSVDLEIYHYFSDPVADDDHRERNRLDQQLRLPSATDWLYSFRLTTKDGLLATETSSVESPHREVSSPNDSLYEANALTIRGVMTLAIAAAVFRGPSESPSAATVRETA